MHGNMALFFMFQSEALLDEQICIFVISNYLIKSLTNKFFDIEVIEHLDRPINQIFELQELSDDNRNLLVSEGRPSLMRFLKLIPKEHDSSD